MARTAAVTRDGHRRPPRPRIEVRQSTATPEVAAAIAAAIEQFLRDTAPAPVPSPARTSRWLRAGLFEAIGLDPAGAGPWGDAERWGA